jgi:hypothetical protein
MKAYKSSKTLKLIDPLAPTISSEFKSFNFPGINAQPKLRCSNITPQAIHKSPTKPGDRAIKITQNIFVSPKYQSCWATVSNSLTKDVKF